MGKPAASSDFPIGGIHRLGMESWESRKELEIPEFWECYAIDWRNFYDSVKTERNKRTGKAAGR